MRPKKISVHPRQSLGQNFLVDDNIIRKIVRTIDPKPRDVILELGAGLGALTDALSAQAGTLIAVEIDKRAVAELRKKLSRPGLEIVERDMLDISLAEYARRFGTRVRIVGNIPYHLTSPLLFRIFDEYEWVSDCVLMVQKEVARRIVADPGGKTYGILSVFTHLYGNAEIMFDISPNCFYPKPKVTSSIVQFTMRKTLPANLDLELFRSVVRTTFGKRRKTLRNSLRYLGDSRATIDGVPLDAVDIDDILRDSPISPERRPETLSVGDFLELTRHLNKEMK